MAVVFSNNARTTLASSASASATSISVVDGSVFPALSGSSYTYVTLEDFPGNVEIVKVTARSGNTLTVVRAQDNTSARAFTAGDKCELRLTAAGLNEVAAQADTDTTYTVGDGGLTQKNFTTTLKTKLDGVAESANNYVLPFTNNSANWNTAYGWGNHALSGYATQSYVGTQVSNLVDSSPATLNTLNELAAALGDDANFSTTVTNSIATKLPLAGGTLTGALIAPSLQLGADSQPTLSGNGNTLRIQTTGGYLDVGANNSGYAHITTDRAKFFFNKRITVDTGEVSSYNEDLSLMRAGSTSARLRITSGTTISDQPLSVTGTATMDGLIVDGGSSSPNHLFTGARAGTLVSIDNESTSTSYGLLTNTASVSANSYPLWVTSNDVNRLTVGGNGDISFYNTAGDSQSLFWDASAKSLGIGTSSPSGKLTISSDAGVANQYLNFVSTQSGSARNWSLGINSGNFRLFDLTANAERLRIAADGAATFNSTIAATGGNSTNWNTAYGWGNHASAGYLTSYTDTNTHTHLDRTDNRTISASEFAAGDLHFGFTSWANNGSAPYADFIHMRSYTDSSGGNDNLLMFKKSGKGIRLWQSSFGSSSAYSSYVDIWDTGTLTTTNKANYDTAYGWGNHASAGYLTSFDITTQTDPKYLRSNADDAFSNTITGNRLYLGGSQIIGSSAALQVNGFQRTGTIYLHEGNSAVAGNNWALAATSSGELRWDTNKLWTAGNDGSGSGLDADLLDGQQGSYYANESARKSVPSSGNYQIVNSTAPSALGSGYLRHDFLNSSGPPGSAYRSVLSISSYTSGSQWTQLSFNYNQGINTPIYFRQNQYHGSTWSSWHQLWDSANDGSGSGLDADLLDGQHGSYYAPASHVHSYMPTSFLDSAKITFTVGGNADTYYPVSIQGGGTFAFQMYSISRSYEATAPSTWNTSSHKGGLTLTWQYSGDSFWGGNDHDIRIIKFAESYSTMVMGMAGSVGGGGAHAGIVVWLRGGNASYTFHGPMGSTGDVNIHLTSVTASNGTVFAPRSFNASTRDGEINPKYPIRASSQLYDNNNRVWSAGNDGSGSGLDADLLDGQQGSYYAPASHVHSYLPINNPTATGTLVSPVIRARKSQTQGNYTTAALWTESLSSTSTGIAFHISGNVGKMLDMRTNGHLYWENGRVWSATSDGSGSGLDADLLDGQHGSYYQPASTAITSANIGSQSVSSADNIDGRGFVNTGSNNGTNADTINSNGISYYISGVTNYSGNATDGALYSQFYSTSWQHQIAGDYRSGQIAIRGKNSGTWQSWIKVWSANNDGSGSGLDADLLDGQHGSYYYPASNPNGYTNDQTAAELLAAIKTVDVNGSAGLNAGTLDGIAATSFVSGDGIYKSSSTSTFHNNVSGFHFYSEATNAPTAEWYNWITARANSWGDSDEYSFQLAHSFWSADGFYVRRTQAGTENSWNKVWTAASDGSGSGLDADLLDGNNSSYYYPASNPNGYTNDQTAAELLAAIKTVDVNGTAGLNAGTLDGLQLHTGRNDQANKVVRTQGDGYIDAGWINTTSGDSGLANDVSRIICSYDNYLRYLNKSDFKVLMGLSKDTYDRRDYTATAAYHTGVNAHGAYNMNSLFNRGSGFIDVWSNPAGRPPTGSHFNGFQALHYSASDTYHHGMQLVMAAGNPSNTYLRGWWGNGGTGYAWQKIWTDGNDGAGSGLDADLLDGQQGSYYYPASNPSGYQTAAQVTAATVHKSDYVTGSAFATTNSVSSVLEYQQASGQSDTKLAPDTSWHNSIRLGHGNPYSYFSSTIAIRMTGSGVGDLYTQNIASGTANGWRKHWSNANDGSGSGLDADLLDGLQASAFLGKGGGTMTGLLAGRVCTTTTVAGANDGGSFSVRGDTSKPAVVSFHRAGAYAVNFGLSTANKMELGGWSAVGIKHTWDFAGNYTAVGNITAYSDIRVKTNIEVIPKALDKVCQLSGYTFDRTDFVPDAETGVMPETRQTGVIAQEVLKVLPEAVSEMDDGKLTVAYGNMVGLLIESIKELKTEIEELKAQIGE